MAAEEAGATRRDFLYIAVGGMGAIGSLAAVWPFLDQMNPTKDVLALSSIEVDISGIEVGQEIKVKWRGKPIFIRRRTAADIETARNVDLAVLPDPEPDQARVKEGKDEWLIMIGICTHFGCIPIGQQGEYGGWFCPCHGSHYDTAGRIRKGPAPRNLDLPDYLFLDDNTVKIG
jgi:ubiquinol-cytochrome c reductase iron-sulfur subunit